MAPIVVLSNPQMQSLTFFWKEHPRFWVGYRVQKGLPETPPQPISVEEHYPIAGWGAFPAPVNEFPSSMERSLPRKRWRFSYREKTARILPNLSSRH